MEVVPGAGGVRRRGSARGGAIVAAALVTLAAGGWWAAMRGAAPRVVPTRVEARGDATDHAAGTAQRDAPALEGTAAAGERGRTGTDDAAGTGARLLAPGPDPLAPPDPRDVAELERAGHALYWGRVLAPDGTPCSGATIWHDAVPCGVTDEQGRYRLVVRQCTWDDERIATAGFDHFLHARKEGVGAAQQWAGFDSRRVDLQLERGFGVSGRVVARGGGPGLAGVRLTLHVPWQSPLGARRPLFVLETTSGADGAFAFETLIGRTVALRGTSEEWASDCAYTFEVNPERGRHGLDFELEPRMLARGWFEPWPPAGLDAMQAAGAIVTAQPDPGPAEPAPPIVAQVASDGRFSLRFPAARSLELALDVGALRLWHAEESLPWEPTPLDLGRIELPEPARLAGVVDLPPDVLELGFELLVALPGGASTWTARAPIAADGRFESPPLPPGAPLLWGIVLGETLAIPGTLRVRDARTGFAGGTAELLAGGERRDLGRVAPAVAIVAGRVVEAAGAPRASARVQCIQIGDEERSMSQPAQLADEQGRFAVELPWEASTRWRLVAAALGARGESETIEGLATGRALRLDVVLGAGATLDGVVVDGEGRPLPHARLTFHATEWRDGERNQHRTRSDADGRFELAGLLPIDYLVLREDEPGEADDALTAAFGIVRAPARGLTLAPASDDPEH